MQPGHQRLILKALRLTLCRVKAVRPEHVPDSGGALLVSNHLSFVDLLLITTTSGRQIRFLVPESFFALRWLRPWLRGLGAIPCPMIKMKRG